MSNEPEDRLLKEKLLEFLHEDIGYGDVTTNSVVPARAVAEAAITMKSDGIVAGVRESIQVFELAGVEVTEHVDDGTACQKGQTIMKVRGQVRSILTVERIALNIMMRMSGIATLTRKVVTEARSVNPKIRIACTRKTTPGFRLFEKRAVEVGGGDTHRLRLDDAVLIKTNHIIASGGIREAVMRARSVASFTKKIEVEASSEDEATEAAKLDLDILMLDNMPPSKVGQTIGALRKLGLKDRVLVEVSGGVTLENIKSYASTGADIISMGLLTHSAPALDVNLRLTKVGIPK